MSTREELTTAIKAATANLDAAKGALAAFEALAENNVFGTLDDAIDRIQDKLERRAFDDCQGANNCGAPQYSQEFMVGGVKYIGTLTVEYNRHDKTYYYVEESSFTYEPA